MLVGIFAEREFVEAAIQWFTNFSMDNDLQVV